MSLYCLKAYLRATLNPFLGDNIFAMNGIDGLYDLDGLPGAFIFYELVDIACRVYYCMILY